MAKNKKSSNKILVIVLAVLIAIAIIALGVNFVQRWITNYIVNKTVTTAVQKSLEKVNDINFDNAKTQTINEILPVGNSVMVQVGINRGNVGLKVADGSTITGEINYLGAKPLVASQSSKSITGLVVKSQDQSGDQAILYVPKNTQGAVSVGVGMGSVGIDLTDLAISKLNVGVGAGKVVVVFPEVGSVNAQLAAGSGSVSVILHKNSGIRLHYSKDMFKDVRLGDQYEVISGGYQTKNYANAKVKINLELGQSLGGFTIKEIE